VIVDFHTHVFPPAVIAQRGAFCARDPTFAELYGDPAAKLASLEDLVASMEGAGIDLSVALGFAWRDQADCRRHNDYLLAASASSGGRVVPFCAAQPAGDGAAFRDEVSRCAEAGARGLGELRPEDQGYGLLSEAGELLARAALEYGLVLLFHVSEPVGHAYPGKGGLRPWELAGFAARYPEVPVVAAHWGGGLPFYRLMPEVASATANVYFDTAASALLYGDAVYEVGTSLASAERVLFGSDFPLLSQTKSRRKVEASRLGARAKRLVLGGNAERLLGARR
jgi:predicted TIM-barrel fold metal-dependent hydrolase